MLQLKREKLKKIKTKVRIRHKSYLFNFDQMMFLDKVLDNKIIVIWKQNKKKKKKKTNPEGSSQLPYRLWSSEFAFVDNLEKQAFVQPRILFMRLGRIP